MKQVSASAIIVLVLMLAPPNAAADHQFRFASPINLVPSAQNPSHPAIASTGSIHAIVYDNFNWNNSSSGVYLLRVNSNGGILSGPTKVSTQTYALYPKVVWTGSQFGILYAAGSKSGTNYDLRYYLARYNSSGNLLGRTQLTGILDYYSYAARSKLLWTGSKFAVFYTARAPSETWGSFPLFCTVSASGSASGILQQFNRNYCDFDVTWDGNRFAVLAVDIWEGWQNVGAAQLLILNQSGEVMNSKSNAGFAPMYAPRGASVIQAKKKNCYIVAIGCWRPTGSSPPPALRTTDVYTARAKVKSAKISGFSPKNATAFHSENWQYPTLIRGGGNTYIVSGCGTGCSFAFASVNDKGRIISTPLHYDFGG